MKRGSGATLAAALTLAVVTGCATARSEAIPRQDAAPLQELATARTLGDHEEIAAWYEREAKLAEERAEAHRLMLGIYASPGPGLSSPGFVEHCQSQIRRYEQVAASNLALARLHRSIAAEARE